MLYISRVTVSLVLLSAAITKHLKLGNMRNRDRLLTVLKASSPRSSVASENAATSSYSRGPRQATKKSHFYTKSAFVMHTPTPTSMALTYPQRLLVLHTCQPCCT